MALPEREYSGVLLCFNVVTEVACGRRYLLALGREVAGDLVFGLADGRDLFVRGVEVGQRPLRLDLLVVDTVAYVKTSRRIGSQ